MTLTVTLTVTVTLTARRQYSLQWRHASPIGGRPTGLQTLYPVPYTPYDSNPAPQLCSVLCSSLLSQHQRSSPWVDSPEGHPHQPALQAAVGLLRYAGVKYLDSIKCEVRSVKCVWSGEVLQLGFGSA